MGTKKKKKIWGLSLSSISSRTAIRENFITKAKNMCIHNVELLLSRKDLGNVSLWK